MTLCVDMRKSTSSERWGWMESGFQTQVQAPLPFALWLQFPLLYCNPNPGSPYENTLSVGSERTLTSRGFSRGASGTLLRSDCPRQRRWARQHRSRPNCQIALALRSPPPCALCSRGTEIVRRGTSSVMQACVAAASKSNSGLVVVVISCEVCVVLLGAQIFNAGAVVTKHTGW